MSVLGRAIAGMGLAAGVLTVFVSPSASGGISVPPHQTDDSPSLSADLALATDASQLAPTMGLTKDAALERLQDQQVASQLVEKIRQAAGPRFSGAWAEDEGSWEIHVRITVGTRLVKVDKLVKASGLPVSLTYDGLYSEADLAAAATAVAREITGTSGVDGIYVDVASEELVADTNPSFGKDGAARLTSLEAPTAIGRESAGLNMEIRLNPHSSYADDANRGGVSMSGCTAGFTVQGSSASGIVTAGHCGNTQKYALTPSGSPGYSAPYITEARTANADLQWNTTPSHTDYASFFGSSATSATTRVGTGIAYVGEGLCHRGRTSGYSCGAVTSGQVPGSGVTVFPSFMR